MSCDLCLKYLFLSKSIFSPLKIESKRGEHAGLNMQKVNGGFSLDSRNSKDIFKTPKQQRLRLHWTAYPLRDLVQSLLIPAFILTSVSKVAYLPWAILRCAVTKEGTPIKILLFLRLIKIFLQVIYYTAFDLEKRKNLLKRKSLINIQRWANYSFINSNPR